jgi:site-specific DNA recombinase
MKAGIYARVSTEDQAINGVSLKDQEERCKSYISARDWKLDGIYRDDGYSGRSLTRPAMQKLLTHTKAKKFDALVILKLDRLTRSVADLGRLIETFERQKIALVSVTESLDSSTAGGRLVMNLLGSVSQWEREVIGERTRDALSYKRAHGLVYGPLPFGFAKSGNQLVPDEDEMRTVRRIFRLREHGRTLQAIADELNSNSVKTKTGKKWAAEQVRYLLANDLYSRFEK